MKPPFPEAIEHVSPFPVEMAEVSFGYNGSPALRDVSFRLPAGGRVAVVGPNGAGKTTLFKLIAGALRPSQGSIRVFGHSASQGYRPVGGHVCIAYVPQRSLIDWSFPVTVSEVVMMGRVRKIGLLRRAGLSDRRETRRALVQVGLQDLAARQIGELSGGEQQRAFLAQALAQGAELILLDEPLTGLDGPSQEALLRVLDELRTSGVTVMVATHDLNLASERFDLVMLLNHRLIALGSPAEVLTKASLLRAYGGHLHALPDEDGVLVLTDTHCEGEDEAA